MAVTITNNGDTTGTITFEATTDFDRLFLIASNWAEYIWNHGYGDHGTDEAPIVYADLSNAEKFALINQRIIDVGKAEAQTNYVNAQQNEARATAKVYADDNLIFEQRKEVQ